MNKKILSILLSALFFVGCDINTTAEGNLNTVKIGLIGPLIGDYSWLGQGNANGALIALEEVTDENWKFELILEDGQCDPKQAVNAYNKLKNDGVVGIVGGACSSEVLAMVPLAERDGIILMSPSATNPDIADAGDFTFRVITSDAFAGKVAAEYLYNDLGYKKVGINAKNDAWGQGLSDVFVKKFEELGGEITTVERHEQNATDMKTQLTKIKNSGAEAIYGPTFSSETVVMVKQMEELGMSDFVLIGGDGTDKSAAKQLINAKTSVIIVGSKKNDDKYAKEFNEKYKARFASDPEAFSSESYDSAMVLALAVKAVGNTETGEISPEEMKNYLYTVNGMKGASGTVTFDKKGESVEKSLALFKFENGNMVEFAVK